MFLTVYFISFGKKICIIPFSWDSAILNSVFTRIVKRIAWKNLKTKKVNPFMICNLEFQRPVIQVIIRMQPVA